MIPSAWVYSSRNYDCFQNSQPVLKPASSLFFTFSPTLQPSGKHANCNLRFCVVM